MENYYVADFKNAHLTLLNGCHNLACLLVSFNFTYNSQSTFGWFPAYWGALSFAVKYITESKTLTFLLFDQLLSLYTLQGLIDQSFHFNDICILYECQVLPSCIKKLMGESILQVPRMQTNYSLRRNEPDIAACWTFGMRYSNCLRDLDTQSSLKLMRIGPVKS